MHLLYSMRHLMIFKKGNNFVMEREWNVIEIFHENPP